MNGEIPNVPITTLAGVASLTDMLPELPLPTPLPVTMHNKSLLFHPKIADDARKILATQDENLITQLLHSLRQTTTDHIELKDTLAGDSIEGEIPELLSGILRRDPNVFKGKKTYDALPSPRGMASAQGSAHPQQMSPFHASPYSPYQQNNTSPRCPPQTSPGWHPPRQNSPYAQHGSPHYQSGSNASSSSRYQQHFQNFAASNQPNSVADKQPVPAVNGEHFPATAKPQRETGHAKGSVSKLQPVVVLSPVHATSAENIEPNAQPAESSSKPPSHRSSATPSTSKRRSPPPQRRKSSLKEPVVLLQPLDPKTIHNLTSHRNKGRHSSDRHRSERGSRPSLTERVKRRRGHVSYNERSPEESRDSSNESENDSRPDTPVEVLAARKRKKDKKNKRHQQHSLSMEELLESATFKKFSTAIENVFDSVEEVDIASFDMNDEETVTPAEILIAKVIMGDISSEAAKLKSQAVLNQIPGDKLVKLLTILQWNIKDGARLLPNINQDDDEESELWREITMDRVMRSVEAGLTAICVMTAPDMPKQVFLEDVMERTIMLAKFQLQNTVYPEFDPVYRIDPNARDQYCGNFKLKRARAGQVKNKHTLLLYNKMTEMIGYFAELIEIQELTDTIILQLSSLGVSTFFVENISELQLNAMKLVTCIFAKYDKHRQLILEDIFASLARLPSSKRNLRNYRLNAEDSIQMVTALALQLIQCVVKLPVITEEENARPSTPDLSKQTDNDVVIVTSYETSMRTGYNFLSVFLKKCTHKGEEDYRPLFENFVQDLLATVNKPEWPASELLLSLLGRILVQQFSNKSVDMSLRTASLEYLGIVAARLRKDAVSSQMDQEMIDEIVEKINDEELDSDEEKKGRHPDKADQTQNLQHSMLEYLAYNGQSEPAYLFARQFYIAQWYRDSTVEAENRIKSQSDAQANEAEFDATEAERTTEVLQNAERRKGFLTTQMATTFKPFSSFKPSPSKLDYDDSCLVARYLSSQRPFAKSFDVYLTQILRVLSETAVAVRTKAMKCLTAVVEADPCILARDDMKLGVNGRFLDTSTSVREAAVELVGKFILIRPELIPSYYDMLSERILDTGISVRKRVIKIFREICLDQPNFRKIPEMCVKMIRRVNDEEGIKKLVNEVFHTMWFTPLRGRNKDESNLLQKVVNITEVVAACNKDAGLDYFEQLLDNVKRLCLKLNHKNKSTVCRAPENPAADLAAVDTLNKLLKGHEDGKESKDAVVSRNALTACKQIVDCLVENVLRLEEKTVELTDGGATSSQRLVACLSTLHLFSKIKPELMVNHATTLQPYLEIRCSSQGDYMVLHCVSRILELVVPLMDHPSESFLVTLEEDMMKLILKHGMTVLQSCVSCLGAVVNCVTHNYKLVKDCFQKFFGVLSKVMADHKSNPHTPAPPNTKPLLLRSLFTVGLLCKHFDFDSKEVGETKVCIKEKVFEVLTYFLSHEDEAVKHKALNGLGLLCIRHYEFMLGKTLKTLYDDLLTNSDSPIRLRIQVLSNLQAYLVEEEVRMAKADAEWRKVAKKEDLKEMGDVQSGMASTIMQIYLKQTLEAFFHSDPLVRSAALNVINLILRQGLVHPVQCVPYLVSMGTDVEASIRIKADQQLQEIEKKYPGFIHMKALAGIKMSFRLQRLLHPDLSKPLRGIREEESCLSLNAYLYTVLRTNRSQRRGFIQTLLNLFDDSAKVSLKELIFIADNMAFFPYLTQDEPLFIIHQIEVIVSVSGSNLMQTFREILYPARRENGNMEISVNEDGQEQPRKETYVEEDDDDDEDKILAHLPENIQPLREVLVIAQGCVLLLLLKQHLKDLYGFTDSKIHRYSPTEGAKVYDKPLSRKVNIKFEPDPVLDILTAEEDEDPSNAKTKLIQEYLEFKQLMLSIDPPDDDDEEEDGRLSPSHKKIPGTAEGDGQVVNGEGTLDKTGPDGETVTPVINTSQMRTPRHHHFKRKQTPRSIRTSASRTSSQKKKPKKKRRRHSGSGDDESDDYEVETYRQPVKKKAKRRRRRFSDGEEESDEDDPDFVI